MVFEDVVTEFVPLEGAEEGEGSFLGSICSQLYALGNLDASDMKMRARKLRTRHLCLQEHDMMNAPKTSQSLFYLPGVALLGSLFEADMLSNLRNAANLFVRGKMKQLADSMIL
ncbi:hypothetical protein Pfo_017204 [Paulownia fortunei]|nr:hypothetical protein Pfo_017204 [Paulownia fortunei]